MPWRYHTGFENGEIGPFVDTLSGTGGPVSVATSTAQPASGARHLRVDLANNDNWSTAPLAYIRNDASDDMIVGVRLAINYGGVWSDWRWGIRSDGTSTQDGYFGLAINFDGSGRVAMGTGDSLATTTFAVLPAGTLDLAAAYHDIEIRWLADSAAGAYEVAVNGVTVASGSGVDTWPSNGAPDTMWGFFVNFDGSAASGTIEVDDFRAGDAFGALQGEMVHELLTPNSTTENDGTVTGAATAHEATDEVPGSDSDYVDLATVGDRLLMGLTDRTFTGDVASIQIVATASAPSGSPEVRTIYEEGGTETDGPPMILDAVTNTRYQTGPVETNPRTGVAWTTADINALQVGARRVS